MAHALDVPSVAMAIVEISKISDFGTLKNDAFPPAGCVPGVENILLRLSHIMPAICPKSRRHDALLRMVTASRDPQGVSINQMHLTILLKKTASLSNDLNYPDLLYEVRAPHVR